jgi:hypothetical protein
MDSRETAAMTEVFGLTNDPDDIENPSRGAPGAMKQTDLRLSAEALLTVDVAANSGKSALNRKTHVGGNP